MSRQAYWNEKDQCWYVPVSDELTKDPKPIEPARVELKDGQLLITLLDKPARVTDME